MRQEVERRMRRGERFAAVEDLIDATDLSADEKAALWLLAWSYVHPSAQRREATAHLARLTAATGPPAIARARHLRIAG
jgi:alkylhydroperoxidase family enzyme